MELEERFWSKASWTLDGWGTRESPCFQWNAAKNQFGYGRFFISGRFDGVAHRVAYELERGEVPDGLELDHLCRNKGCVNPWHLEPVTRRENIMRGPLPEVMRNIPHDSRGYAMAIKGKTE